MNAVTRVSAKGQIVIPKDVRDRLKWSQGTELEVIDGAAGVMLRVKTVPVDETKFEAALAKLRATVGDVGPVVSDQEADAAIDEMFRNDPKWAAPRP